MTTRVGPTEDRTVAERPTSLGGFTWVDGLMLCVVLIWGLNFVVLKLALPEFELLAFVAVRRLFSRRQAAMAPALQGDQ